ncbi:response regulator [Pseudoalteromonas sp. SSDWG2]|uniref:response regulator n=1 Tax=Pseudoalteromonas sp. SSDWG2 TaxID=3139391 RepID=UPI003BA86C8B
MHNITKHFRVRYIFAAIALILVVSLSVSFVFYVSKMQESDAKIINVAGMQRMLSQKISMHKHALVYQPNDFDREQLEQSVATFIANHQFLLNSDMVTHNRGEVLLYAGNNLDLQVRKFARLALESSDLTLFSGTNLLHFLEKLDAVVSAMEHSSQSKIAQMQRILPLLALIAFITVCCEWFLIFKPLLVRINRMLVILRKQRMTAVRASRIKSDFLANVSHELMTPINGITGLLAEPDKVSKSDIKSVSHCALNLQSVVQEMLDMQQLQEGKLKFEESSNELNNSINAVIAPLQLNPEFKQRLKVQVESQKMAHLRVRTDHVRFIQVLNQLVSNALKHTHGDVLVVVEYQPYDQNIRVDIRDQGEGIKAQELAAIQHNALYYDTDKVHNFKGIKMGLPLAFALTHIAKGELHFEHLKSGTLAQLIWPASESVPETKIGSKSQTRKALVVDDNTINVLVISNMVKIFDFEVDVAQDGEAAVERVKSGEYDCIFMDINMPNMDGIEATSHIRTTYNFDGPILLVTASQDERRIKQGLIAGANLVVHKPVSIEKIKAALVEVQLAQESE